MATKREIQQKMADLEKELETADDDDDFVEVYRVKKSHIPWLFQQSDAPEGESEDDGDGEGDDGEGKAPKPKDEPKPKPRNKYFGG